MAIPPSPRSDIRCWSVGRDKSILAVQISLGYFPARVGFERLTLSSLELSPVAERILSLS